MCIGENPQKHFGQKTFKTLKTIFPRITHPQNPQNPPTRGVIWAPESEYDHIN